MCGGHAHKVPRALRAVVARLLRGLAQYLLHHCVWLLVERLLVRHLDFLNEEVAEATARTFKLGAETF